MGQNVPQPASTQAHLPISAIEEGVVILRDGSYRAVIRTNSTNFLLKSEQEQNAIVIAYQNFLNALNYPLQIIMQSRKLDLEPYLKALEGRVTSEQNELVRQQITDYVAYVRELIGVANIMDKRFYVVVPYTPVATSSKGVFSQIFKTKAAPTVDQTQFAAHREELLQRTQVIAGGLSAMGLKSNVLETDELVRLFYTTYNYDIASEERLDNPSDLAEGVVSAGAGKEEDNSTDDGIALPEQPVPEVTPVPVEPAPDATPTPAPAPETPQ